MEEMIHRRRGLNPNPNSNSMRQKKERGTEKKENERKNSEFEFCKVCRLNHNQGLRHEYFPKHRCSLSDFPSRFKNKIGDVLFFLKNPTILRHEHASRNRFWCIFCDTDIDELHSSLARENTINHLASERHLKNLKHFIWRYGGGMDCLDTFRVLDADLAEWEKKCKSLSMEALDASEVSSGVLYGSSNDIHHRLNFENINNIDLNAFNPLQSNHSNPVMALQYHTLEYQLSDSGVHGVANIGSNHHGVTVCSALDTYFGTSFWDSSDLRDNGTSQHYLMEYAQAMIILIMQGHTSHIRMEVWYVDRPLLLRIRLEEICILDHLLLGLKQQVKLLDGHVKTASSSFVYPSNKSGKSQKLNSRRVSAAWAEKRKMELEREKKEVVVKNDFVDANWLPNFGRVWQPVSRKESRKEFEEKQKLLEFVNDPEKPIDMQPYISKLMGRDAGE